MTDYSIVCLICIYLRCRNQRRDKLVIHVGKNIVLLSVSTLIPVDTYFGSARLWSWEIIYYRRLKKGPISIEKYARRMAQNREFIIVGKYIRSSSGWGELSLERSRSEGNYLPSSFWCTVCSVFGPFDFGDISFLIALCKVKYSPMKQRFVLLPHEQSNSEMGSFGMQMVDCGTLQI